MPRKETEISKPKRFSARAARLTAIERAYFKRRLRTIDDWWPIYAMKHPKARKEDVARRLLHFVEKRTLTFSSGTTRVENPGKLPIGKPGRPDFMPYVEPWRSLRRLLTLFNHPPFLTSEPPPSTGCPTMHGTALASAFKHYSVETSDFPSTQAPAVFSFAPEDGDAAFWAGFERFDTWWDDIDPSDESAADRVVHLAVLKIALPPPVCDVTATFRTARYVALPRGIEIIDNFGGLDDSDGGSITVDFCAAIQPAGGDFPDASAFSLTPGFTQTTRTESFLWSEAWLDESAGVAAGVSPNVYLGIRLLFEGADCRSQIGFTENALDAYFGFRYPDTSNPPGLHYSYTA